MAIKAVKVEVMEVLQSLFEMNYMTVAAVGVAAEQMLVEIVEVKAAHCYCCRQICCCVFVTPLTFFLYLNLSVTGSFFNGFAC